MKIFLLLISLLFMVSCASNKQVYWCGDHPCANNNEKKKYFKEKMIVEVKIIEKKKYKKYVKH